MSGEMLYVVIDTKVVGVGGVYSRKIDAEAECERTMPNNKEIFERRLDDQVLAMLEDERR